MIETTVDPTEGLSDEEWLATLSEAERERFSDARREVERCFPDADATSMIRADRAERHAPLALHMLMDSVRHSGPSRRPVISLEDAYREDWKRLREDQDETKAALEALGRMVAAGVSEDDLRVFAHVIGLAKIDYVFWAICQGGFSGDVPGWRLMEVGCDGRLTGRPLSIWGVYASDPVSELEGGEVADAQPGEPSADPS